MAGSPFPSETEADELLVGPDSIAWRATSDLRLNVALLYPLLLQVAHPTVGAGVTDYSDFEQRPWDRLMRSLDWTTLLVYGGRDAVAAGHRLREFHQRFRGTRADGTRYSALEPEAYAWVHATLLNTYVLANAHFGTPLKRDEVERFYREYRGLGRLIGVRERDLPPTWTKFCAYFRRTTRTKLERTAAVERVLHTIGHVSAPPAPITGLAWPLIKLPAQRAVWLGGIGLVEPDVRRRLNIGWSIIDEGQFRVLGLALRGLTPLMPEPLRVTGPGHLRWRRNALAGLPLGPA